MDVDSRTPSPAGAAPRAVPAGTVQPLFPRPDAGGPGAKLSTEGDAATVEPPRDPSISRLLVELPARSLTTGGESEGSRMPWEEIFYSIFTGDVVPADPVEVNGFMNAVRQVLGQRPRPSPDSA